MEWFLLVIAMIVAYFVWSWAEYTVDDEEDTLWLNEAIKRIQDRCPKCRQNFGPTEIEHEDHP